MQKTLPNLFEHYNGVEFQVNTRIQKATVFAGFTIGKDYGTPSGGSTDLNNPNNLINYRRRRRLRPDLSAPRRIQLPVAGKIQFAGSLRENSGLPQARTLYRHATDLASQGLS